MEKLNIDWLHDPVKEGRRSGRTTEMLANAVGCALVADRDTEIFIVCAPKNEMSMYHNFIDVLRSISPSSTYFRNIKFGYPSICIPIGASFVHVMFTNRADQLPSRGIGEDMFVFIDHYFEEYKKMKSSYDNRPRKNLWEW